MKNRRTILSLFVLASLAFVGVGYAALTRQLTANTDLKADTNINNLDVKFDSVEMGYQIVSGNPSAITVGVEPVISNPQSADVTITGISGYEDEVHVYLLVVNASAPSKNLGAVLTTPNIVVTHGVNSEKSNDKNDAADVFEGNHFLITASYTNEVPADLKDTKDDTLSYAIMGELNETTNEGVKTQAPTLAPKASNEAAAGEGVWLKITYKLVTVVTEEFDVHKVTVSFAANSTTIE